jgi:CelD/BcsL family acetyltransferase involved in cellulose biosynthesis
VTVEVVNTESGFDALREEWNGLVSKLALPSPFQSWEWHRGLWRHFSISRVDRLNLILFRRAGNLVGLASMKARTRLGVTELSPLGWRDRLTEYSVLLFPEDEQTQLLQELWGWLEAHKWTSTCLPQLGQGVALPATAGPYVVTSEPIVFEHLLLPQSWEAFDRGLNQSMRSNVRYYPKLMAREGHAHSFEIARAPEEVAAALPTLWALHSARAAARTKIRHHDYMKPPARRAFLAEVLPLLASRGEAAIGLMKVDGVSVGAQIWLERDGSIFLYYSGFDPVWSRYSVAMITTSEILRDAIARGIIRVEFLRGANHFKSRWGTEARVETESVLARHRRLIQAREAYLLKKKRLRRRFDRWLTRLEGIVPRTRRPA